jgi:aminocarboxymuconate-semialdehyde decarboxylase
MVRAAPDRFRGLGMVPLQDMDAAQRELEHAMHQLGLDGVEIATNINGVALGHSSLEPFFAAAESLGAAIFVHPLRPAGMDRLVGPANLEQVVAFPCETALAIASVITGGLMKRHPRLRIGFSHGGGAFGQVLPRMQHAWTAMAPIKAAMDEPRATARKLFYDTLVYDETALRFLIESYGSSQLMIGSDYPFSIMDRRPTRHTIDLGLSDAESDQVLFKNARRFLDLDANPAAVGNQSET